MVGRRYVLAVGLQFLAILSGLVRCQSGDATAYFSMQKVSGYIDFTVVDGTETKATFQLSGVDSWLDWEVMEFPVLTTEPCSDSILGNSLIDLSPYQNISKVSLGSTAQLTGVSLYNGEKALLGRAVLITSGNKRACATIEGRESLSYSVINGPAVAGDIKVRKVGSRYAVLTDLFHTQSLQSTESSLKIYESKIATDTADASGAEIDITENRCSKVESGSAPLTTVEVPVAGGESRQRSMVYISGLPESFNFSDGSAVIDSKACSNFHQYERKMVRSVFSRDGAKGSITFTQENPYKPTQVAVELSNLGSKAGGYHVHVYPLPYEYAADTTLCGAEQVGGHWNPFSATTGDTQDEFEVGDLSGKHGALNGLDEINKTYQDLYLPLFGEHSIVGRSVVIHAANGDRWICANIGHPGPVTVAKAEFNGDVEGTITFIQEENKPWADTTVFVEMTDSGETSSSTSNHNFHIHTHPVGDDYLTVDGRCVSAQGHWNPFQAPVTDADMYGKVCAARKLSCEVGDLSNKYKETIDIPASPAITKYLYTDQLPLSSSYSIIGKSVTIHGKEKAAARYVCADIVRKLSPALITKDMWHGVDGSDVDTGIIQMSSSGITGDITTLSVDLKGLNSKAGGYHIHQLPLDTSASDSSVCASTAAHFNPFGVKDWLPSDSMDHYEVADLSNKFGMLTGKDNYQLEAQDTNLPLTGPNSVVGRSVVIHESADSAPRWKCTDTIWNNQAMGGVLLQAKAEFTADIKGHITLSQVVTSDGEGEVNIEVTLWHETGEATSNHNWHVHESYVTDGDCLSAGGHYNPFLRNVTAPSYAECGLHTPRKCELGDMSAKLGTVDIGTKDTPTRYVFNDDFLSLSGKFPILGRSIVIHAAERGAPRVACADITPFGPYSKAMQYYIKTDSDMAMGDMADAIMDEMANAGYYNIYVKAGEQMGDCTSVSVHYTGERADQLGEYFDADKLDEKYRSMDEDVCRGEDSAATQLQVHISTLLLLLVVRVVSL